MSYQCLNLREAARSEAVGIGPSAAVRWVRAVAERDEGALRESTGWTSLS